MPPAPLLSICIPTYNRSRFLRETLESVLASLVRLADPTAVVELLVCDNASPDDTPTVLEEFRLRWPALKIFRNSKNIGELNFYTTLQHATGQYVWLLGDDDLVKPEFLPAVIGCLAAAPDLIVCNHSIHSLDFSTLHRGAFHPRSAPLHFDSRDEVLATFGIALGFISAAIIRREHIANVPQAIFERFGAYGLSFIAALGTALGPHSTTAFLREPLLRYRGGNSPIDWENVFITGVAATLKYFLEIGYSATAIRRAKAHTIRHYLLPRLIQLKKDDLDTKPLLSRAASVFSTTPIFYLLAVPLAAVPAKAFLLLRWFRPRG